MYKQYKQYKNRRKKKGFTDVTVIVPGSAQQVFEGIHYNYKYLQMHIPCILIRFVALLLTTAYEYLE